jgi:hypothetical protein
MVAPWKASRPKGPPMTILEMQKVEDSYLQCNKAQGLYSLETIQAEMIKTMPTEQLQVRTRINEILATGPPQITVTKKEMTGRLSLLHKGGPQTNLTSHFSY